MKTKPFDSVRPPTPAPICGVVVSSSWHEPVACAYPPDHEGVHSWASIPALDPRSRGTCTDCKAHDGPCWCGDTLGCTC